VKNTISIANERMRLSIEPDAGGRLASCDFLVGAHWQPLLRPTDPWQKDTWSHGGMPLCWPFAGRSWHQDKLAWQCGNMTYPMPIHGFAWQQAWQLEEKRSDFLRLSLQDNDESKTFYPFAFRLEMSWQLDDRGLHANLKIINRETSPRKLPFAAGFHPYFNFSKERLNLQTQATSFHAVTAEGKLGALQEHVDQLAQWPAFGFTSLIAKSQDDLGFAFELEKVRVHFQFDKKDFPWLVFWSDPKTAATCIEPWQAPPNSWQDHPDQLRWLEPGESHSLSFRINATPIE